jgi:hypothetical protein
MLGRGLAEAIAATSPPEAKNPGLTQITRLQPAATGGVAGEWVGPDGHIETGQAGPCLRRRSRHNLLSPGPGLATSIHSLWLSCSRVPDGRWRISCG